MGVWDKIVGQAAAVQIFQSAAQAARTLIEHEKTAIDLVDHTSVRALSHAWLITGPPGSGRSNLCLAFAAALQCSDSDLIGCGCCQGCRTVLARSHADVKMVSTDRVIIKMSEVESLITLAQQSPSNGKWRLIIIEDADRMVERTSNLLLKAIEEPPPRTIWMLCAPNPQDVLSTIRSRCRLVSLTTPSIEEVAQLLVREQHVSVQEALQAAALAQCHIGLARHLVKDPEAVSARRELIRPVIEANTLAKAIYAADHLLTQAKAQAEAQTKARNQAEERALRKSLGIESDAKRIPPQLRPQFTALGEDQKRRSTRVLRDVLDRALLDLMGYYRDVYTAQIEAQVPFINLDLVDQIHLLARHTPASHTVKRIDAVRSARRRLASNVAPSLALEAMMMVLKH